MSMEDANSRMNRLGRAELLGLPHLSLDERLAKVEEITAGDIRDLAGQTLGGPRVIGAAGPFDASHLEKYVA